MEGQLEDLIQSPGKITMGPPGQETGLVLGSWPAFPTCPDKKPVELPGCYVQVGAWLPEPGIQCHTFNNH